MAWQAGFAAVQHSDRALRDPCPAVMAA